LSHDFSEQQVHAISPWILTLKCHLHKDDHRNRSASALDKATRL